MSSSLWSATVRPWVRSAIVKASQVRTISLKPLCPTLACRYLSNTTWMHRCLSTMTVTNGRSRAAPPPPPPSPLCLWIFQQQRGFASKGENGANRAESDDQEEEEEEEEEEFIDENGMTMREREKIEKWAKNFTKDSIPKGLLTLNFVRSSGPGGQNVNKVNTKVDMRFAVDEAMWLPQYVRNRLKSEESNKINKSGEYVLASDSKRTQMANLDDCMEKLHAVLLRMANLPTLPDAAALAKLARIRRAGDNRRKANKQLQSKKKASRRIGRDD